VTAETGVTTAIQTGTQWRNWGRSESAHPQLVAHPTSVDEVVEVVRFARERGLAVKAIGAGHSFTGIAVAPGIQIELSGLQGLISVDVERGRVTLAAGTNLYRLPELLGPHGLALENMGDIDRQTVAGATSTGTHGTGSGFTGLAGQIVGVVLVTADAAILRIDETENAELLPAARLGLGALGVLVEVTIQCVPAFVLDARERPESFDAVLDEFDARSRSVDHFEFYWFPHTQTVLTKTNTRMPGDTPTKPLGAVREWVDDRFMSNAVLALISRAGHAFPKVTPPINRLATRLTGNRDFRDSSPRVFASPRTVRFREMEYAIPRAAIPQALRQVRALIEDRGWIISFPIEVRVASADELWLSTAQGRESGYIAVHRYYREDYDEYFRAVEQIMRGFGGRPHWGKIHFQDAESLGALYPHHSDFVAVRDRLDPERVFANPYLERVLGK
jgi:FAD-linked oxidoreductase